MRILLFSWLGLALLSTPVRAEWTVAQGTKIKISHSGSGIVKSARVHSNGKKLFVHGTVKKGASYSAPMHLDVELIDARGKVIARKHDKLRSPQSRNPRSAFRRNYPYAVSFDTGNLAPSEVRVKLHAGLLSDCKQNKES